MNKGQKYEYQLHFCTVVWQDGSWSNDADNQTSYSRYRLWWHCKAWPENLIVYYSSSFSCSNPWERPHDNVEFEKRAPAVSVRDFKTCSVYISFELRDSDGNLRSSWIFCLQLSIGCSTVMSKAFARVHNNKIDKKRNLYNCQCGVCTELYLFRLIILVSRRDYVDKYEKKYWAGWRYN